MVQIKISMVAKNYASSLVEVANSVGISYEKIYENLLIVKEIIDSSLDLQKVLKNPSINLQVKYEIIEEVFKNEINQSIVNFFKILIEKNRFDEFDKIVSAYRMELDKINGIQRVDVTSAIELSEEKKRLVVEKLQNKLSKNIIANWNIDESIIAGLVVEIDDNIIDTSLRNKIEKMKSNLSL
ncbi:MAG: ATP synthase F1 subunit delta [Candidatus Gastranaerophilales bacterium]